ETEATNQVVRVGCYQCTDTREGYLRLLLEVLTVKMFAKKAPDIWARDANFGRVVVEQTSTLEEGQLRLVFKELGRFPYFGLVAQGWLAAALEEMGHKELSVGLNGWSLANPDPGE